MKHGALLLGMAVAVMLCVNHFADQRDREMPEETLIEQTGETEPMEQEVFYITAGEATFTAMFADNPSAVAFRDLLKQGEVTVPMHDYGGFEKVGALGHTLPRSDTQITTEPGDVILYLGDQITVYYDVNTWDFTRLGKIEDVTGADLLAAFGEGDVTLTFSIGRGE